jgi:hypothetical protein
MHKSVLKALALNQALPNSYQAILTAGSHPQKP